MKVDRDIYNRLKQIVEIKDSELLRTRLQEFLKDIKPYSQRTLSQNNSIHLYLTQLADAMQREGVTMQDVMKAITKLEVMPTMVSLKENVWKPLQKATLGKESTTKLDKLEEIDQVYDMINEWTGLSWGIHVPFPSDETRGVEYYTYKNSL